MANAILKTKKESASVSEFLNSIEDETKRQDAKQIAALMQEITGWAPKMWGSSIVGFGDEHLKYESGRELDWFVIGFSPRKQNISLYLLRGGVEKYTDLLAKLGKHELGKGCLYIKHLHEVDHKVLKTLMKTAMSHAHSTTLS